MEPRPITVNMQPNQSNLPALFSSRLSGTDRTEIVKTTNASGRLMKKMARHEMCSISQPPRTGPTAAVMAVKADHVPIACPRSRFIKRSADDGETSRNQERGAKSLQSPRDDQLLNVRSKATPGGSDGEYGDADQENTPTPVIIA